MSSKNKRVLKLHYYYEINCKDSIINGGIKSYSLPHDVVSVVRDVKIISNQEKKGGNGLPKIRVLVFYYVKRLIIDSDRF